MRPLLVAGLWTVLACAPQPGAAEADAPRCDGIVGVWEYVPPSAPGTAIIARQGTNYLGVSLHSLSEPYSEQTRPRDASGGPALYSVAGAWELTCESAPGAARLRLHWLYSSFRPQDVGTEVVFELERAGREAKWWYIGPDGKRGTMGASRLIK